MKNIYNFIDTVNEFKNISNRNGFLLSLVKNIFQCNFVFIANTKLNTNGTYEVCNKIYHFGINDLFPKLKEHIENDKDTVFQYAQKSSKPFLINNQLLQKENNCDTYRTLKHSKLKSGIAYHYKSPCNKGTYIAIGFEKYNTNVNLNNLFLLYTLAPHISNYIYYQLKNKLLNDTTPLTIREKQVLSLFKNGEKPTSISNTLFITERTVRFHLDNVVSKLNANNKTHAISIALRLNII